MGQLEDEQIISYKHQYHVSEQVAQRRGEKHSYTRPKNPKIGNKYIH